MDNTYSPNRGRHENKENMFKIIFYNAQRPINHLGYNTELATIHVVSPNPLGKSGSIIYSRGEVLLAWVTLRTGDR